MPGNRSLTTPIAVLAGADALAVEQPAELIDQAPRPSPFAILLRPTGAGDLDDYRRHPLCPSGPSAEGWAHILRGVSGLVGVEANLAIVDVAVGVWKLLRRPADEGAGQ